MAFSHDDDHFRTFAASLSAALTKYGKMQDGELLATQRRQLEALFALEQEFRATLIAHPWGPGVYRLFIDKICVQNGNILTARPYFRERQSVCIGPISSALERKDHETLYRYNFNYQFVTFAIHSRSWPAGAKLRKLAVKISEARDTIIELNTPLAISQARIFWSKAPAKAPVTHLQYMDFVQISCDGLISAVDKFVLPNAKKFRSERRLNEAFRKFRPMMVQRMVGNFIESYSETMVHFYPKDKRKLYRANKFMVRQQGPADYEKVAEAVNKDGNGKVVETQAMTTASEINDLLSAASAVTLTTETSSIDLDEERDNPLDRCASPDDWRPDVRLERSELASSLSSAIVRLSVLDQKLLRLKGVGAAIV